ncbi:unnamed protein product [Mycena citricolor]|uniref:F-box domain-containing protein n=1 Tax=Mycena citricolor TaxID=2018698 RepID=A0AAD2GZQ1_9AGAR|nr:unnamed protein product [Mycena citricolor]
MQPSLSVLATTNSIPLVLLTRPLGGLGAGAERGDGFHGDSYRDLCGLRFLGCAMLCCDGDAGATILAVLARAGIRPEILQINCPAYELRSSSPQSVGFGFPFAPSLVHLALQLHNDTFLDALVDHICSFPKLQSLEITGSARVTVREDAWPKTTALPQNLRRLVLAYPEILDWVITSGRIPSTVDQMVIRDLETSPQWASVSRFLASEQAEGLSSLEFQNCNMDHLHSAIAPYVPSLQHLSIELFPAAPPLSASTALIRLFTTFRGMASSLEILTLFAPTLAAFDDTEWDRLDSLFTQSHSLSLPLSQPFPALSRLRLRVRVRSPRTRDLAYDYGLPTPYVHRISAQMGAWSKGSVVLDF